MTRYLEGGIDITGTPVTGKVPVVQSDGSVQWADAPSGESFQGFIAHQAAAHAPLSAGAVVVLDTEDLDTDGWYTAGTGRFLPTVAGVYELQAILTPHTALDDEEWLTAAILKNGQVQLLGVAGRQITTPLLSAPAVSLCSGKVLSDGNDYFELIFYTNKADNQLSIDYGTAFTSYFSGQLLGAT